MTDREHLQNLLAIIHGDGGHHQDQVGTAQAVTAFNLTKKTGTTKLSAALKRSCRLAPL